MMLENCLALIVLWRSQMSVMNCAAIFVYFLLNRIQTTVTRELLFDSLDNQIFKLCGIVLASKHVHTHTHTHTHLRC